MQGIAPFLWFENQAEEAAKFYTSIFKDSTIKSTSHYGEGAPVPAGTVMVVSFELNGQEFMALNGGPYYKFNEAVSFVINCDTQEEIDFFWDKLSAGGTEMQCGWLKDKYGLCWQVVPAVLGKLMSDPARASRVLAALMQMVKLDIRKLVEA